MNSWPGPRRSVEAESKRRGRADFVAGCAELALGGPPDDQDLIIAVGGPPARWVVTGEAAGPDYWLRVWALRGLLWVWGDSATTAVIAALGDECWRVREMAAKVVARHRIDEALDHVVDLQMDMNERVRTAARRALVRLTSRTP